MENKSCANCKFLRKTLFGCIFGKDFWECSHVKASLVIKDNLTGKTRKSFMHCETMKGSTINFARRDITYGDCYLDQLFEPNSNLNTQVK